MEQTVLKKKKGSNDKGASVAISWIVQQLQQVGNNTPNLQEEHFQIYHREGPNYNKKNEKRWQIAKQAIQGAVEN